MRALLTDLGRLLDTGHLRPLVNRVFPLEQARAAYARAQACGIRGKIGSFLSCRPTSLSAKRLSHGINLVNHVFARNRPIYGLTT
jgi:Zinc-binding dehydrogenase